MLKVAIQDARPGMVLARSIPNPESLDLTLLKAGFKLEEEHTKRLRSLKVNSIWVQYPKLDFLDELIDSKVISSHQELYKELKGQFATSQELSLTNVDYRQYINQVGELFHHMLRTDSHQTVFLDQLQTEGSDVFKHGVTVAYLALVVGMRLETFLVRNRSKVSARQATDLIDLGVGCLLHDIGKLMISEELRDFHLTASDLGSPQWQKHTEYGYEMIHGGLPATAGQIVFNHHQHYDGSGFPKRKCLPGGKEPIQTLSGEEIHAFCRIAAICDRFDGLRHLPDGSTAPPVVSINRLRKKGYAEWFDPDVYRIFMETIPPFGLGEMVTLNNGQVVVVTELNENDPCRPLVRPINPELAVEPATKQTDGKEENEDKDSDIALAACPNLHIALVGDFDVTKYLY